LWHFAEAIRRVRGTIRELAFQEHGLVTYANPVLARA